MLYMRDPTLVLVTHFPTKIKIIKLFNEWCKVAPSSFKNYFVTQVIKSVTVIYTSLACCPGMNHINFDHELLASCRTRKIKKKFCQKIKWHSFSEVQFPLIAFSLLRCPTTPQAKLRHIPKIHPVYHIL
jgi:hypothetical protein